MMQQDSLFLQPFHSDTLEDIGLLDETPMDTAWIVDAHDNDDFWLPPRQPETTTADCTGIVNGYGSLISQACPRWSEPLDVAPILRNTQNLLPLRHTAHDFIQKPASRLFEVTNNAMGHCQIFGVDPHGQGEYLQQMYEQSVVSSPPNLSVTVSSYSNSRSPPKKAAKTAPCGRRPRKSSKAKRGIKAKEYPVPPLTAYNYYFRVERERLLDDDANPVGDEGELPVLVPSNEHPLAWIIQEPKEFKNSVLRDQWGRDPDAKRKHSKTHGRISFKSMTAQIAKSWNALPGNLKSIFQEIAADDFGRYSSERRKLYPSLPVSLEHQGTRDD